MTQSNRATTTAAMFADYTAMSEREAEAYVLREFAGVNRSRAAEMLGDISESTVDSLVQNAKQDVQLPHVSRIVRQSPTNTGLEEREAVEAWFENGAGLRYVELDDGSIHEQTIAHDDPHSIYKDHQIDTASAVGDDACLDEYLTASLEVYFEHDGLDTLRGDWDTLYEALTGYSA